MTDPDPPRRRRGDPTYRHSALANPAFRKLIAGLVEEKVSMLVGNGRTADAADAFIADQLDEFANELRGVQ